MQTLSALLPSSDDYAVPLKPTAAHVMDAVRTGKPVRLKDGEEYVWDVAVRAPEGVPLRIYGSDSSPSAPVLRAAKGFQGIMLQPSGYYDIRNLRMAGSDGDDCTLIGSDAQGATGRAILDNLYLKGGNFGVYFGPRWEHPIGLSVSRIYAQDFRTGGLCYGGLQGAASQGESGWDFQSILLTNNGAAPIAALAQSVQRDAPDPSHDTVTWSTAEAAPFGWVVMRSRDGRTAWQIPPNWAEVSYAKDRFVARKKPGENWTYKVVRNTVGLAIRRAKAISISAVQAEYVGIGVWLQDVIGANIGSLYAESRAVDPPRPALAALWASRSTVNVQQTWCENYGYALVAADDSDLQYGYVRANHCHHAAIGLGGATQQVARGGRIDPVQTPAAYASLTGSAYDWTRDSSDYRGKEGWLERVVDAPERAGFSVYRRGGLVGRLGMDALGLVEVTADRPRFATPSKQLEAPFRTLGAIHTALVNGTPTPCLRVAAGSEGAHGMRLDFSIEVLRKEQPVQVCKGSLDIAMAVVGGKVTVGVAAAPGARALSEGSLSDPRFSAEASAREATIACMVKTDLADAVVRIRFHSSTYLGTDMPAITVL